MQGELQCDSSVPPVTSLWDARGAAVRLTGSSCNITVGCKGSCSVTYRFLLQHHCGMQGELQCDSPAPPRVRLDGSSYNITAGSTRSCSATHRLLLGVPGAALQAHDLPEWRGGARRAADLRPSLARVPHAHTPQLPAALPQHRLGGVVPPGLLGLTMAVRLGDQRAADEPGWGRCGGARQRVRRGEVQVRPCFRVSVVLVRRVVSVAVDEVCAWGWDECLMGVKRGYGFFAESDGSVDV
eukprot:9450497-Pyramimonas_sp.AAC.1